MELIQLGKNFRFFTGDRVCVFKSHHRIQVPKTSKKVGIKVSLYLFSQCFGNSHSYIQIKSNDDFDDLSAKLKHLNSTIFLIPSFSLQGWKAVILNLGKAYLSHTKTAKPLNKQGQICQYQQVALFYVDTDRVKQSSIFVTASIFNLQFFV